MYKASIRSHISYILFFKGLMTVFQAGELKRLKPLLIFFIIYSVLFYIFVKTFTYSLPFIIGLLISTAIQPVIRFLERKFHFKHGLATAVTTTLAIAVFLVLIGFLSVFAVREISAFIVKISNGGFTEFSEPVTNFLNRIGGYLNSIDMSFIEQNREEILAFLESGTDFILSFLKTALAVLTSLPAVITMLLVIIFSTYFISRDMNKARTWLKRVLSSKTVSHVKNAKKNSSDTGKRYLLSYLLIYFITFCETVVIMSVLNVQYPLTISLITAVADVLPALGPGFVFIPLSVYQLLLGEYSKAAGILIGWAIITCIRQIIEPKLVASGTKLHPLTMLAAIYFSLVGRSLWILFYVMGFFLLHSVLRQSGALPQIAPEKVEKKAEETAEE